MLKNILIVCILVVATGAGWYFYNINKYAPTTYVKDTPAGQVTVNTETKTVSTTTPTYTLTQISEHSTAESCYSSINGIVYDLTAWVNMHPGGQGPILSVCGKDGTEKFMKKHKGGEKYVTKLGRFKIGTLTQ